MEIKQKYVDLHRHSEYSLLDGAIKIKDMVEKTPQIGAITDHGNMFGFLEYYKAMTKAGKVPIIGMEAYTESVDGSLDRNHLVLLCKNNTGYKNLMKLSSMSYREENMYRNRPHIRYKDLFALSEGLVVLSACLGGEIPKLLAKGHYDQAVLLCEKFQKHFKDDFYLEIQRHGIALESIVNPQLIKISREHNIKLVATSDAHYPDLEDRKYHEALLAMQTGKTLKDNSRMVFEGYGYHIPSEEEMFENFKDLPEAVENTVEVARKCTGLNLDLSSYYLPKFPLPEGFEKETAYLKHLARKGLEDLGLGDRKEYIERLDYELSVIDSMGFPGYFLIVWDFVRFAKEEKIPVGPGRGSAGGSLVCYSLGITKIDPLENGLIFERFLNPDRVSMPDIDIDFGHEDRERVIDYVREKYGTECVSNIITFGTLGAKMVVRDVVKTLGYPYKLGDKISKLIPEKPKITLDEAMEEEPELAALVNDSSEVKEIMEYAKKLEGLKRHASKHACGVCIANKPISEFIPEATVGPKNNKALVTQVTMTEVEDLGILKMDFLALKTMTAINEAVMLINMFEKKNYSYNTIPVDDPYVYKLMAEGSTSCLFQLESPGLTDFMKKLYRDIGFRKYLYEKDGKECFRRLVAGISLYRPGPLDYIPDYLKGMENPGKIVYDHELLKDILEETYGIIVYQEQVMAIARKLAGYTMAGADNLRKAMGKKHRDIMEREKPNFISGCLKNGADEEAAEKIWNKMEKFCEYAFNKSHSTGYAILAAQTAWLKYYYPSYIYASTINTFRDDIEKIEKYILDFRAGGGVLYGPDVNKSMIKFSPYKDGILYGLSGIKSVGRGAEAIVVERMKNGKYKDFVDFVRRNKELRKNELEALVLSGACDGFSLTRRAMIEGFGKIQDTIRLEDRKNLEGQFSLFVSNDSNNDIKIENLREYHRFYLVNAEYEYIGTNMNLRELFKNRPRLEYADDTAYIRPYEISRIRQLRRGVRVGAIGIVRDVKYFNLNLGRIGVRLKIEDETGQID